MSSTLALTVLLVWLGATWANPAEPKYGETEDAKNYEVEQYLTNLIKYYKSADKNYEPEAVLSGVDRKTKKVVPLACAKPGQSVRAKFNLADFDLIMLRLEYKLLLTDYINVTKRLQQLAGKNIQEVIVYDLLTPKGEVLTRYTNDILKRGEPPKNKVVPNKCC